ncbi:MAG: hypothetical protein GT589_04790 [Peptoclostridium sp.]|uniref:TatD family hydrolase n=1 Tax=Peptoclostridium sp. TaxID=1904860 RepID=UPI00139CEF64|nr:TatD family hydrolase [Peptoclostridium sp.]MZQ75460.1 hypothetical protein [Peptoclostridium sp.]
MFIDVHCHIDQYDSIEGLLNENVKAVIGAATDYVSGEKILGICRKNEGFYAALGIHPEYSGNFEQLEAVKKQIEDNKDEIVAIGEIGLPYYSLEGMDTLEAETIYKKSLHVFEEFLSLASRLQKPVVLHAIEATAYDALRLLEKHNIESALFHWFEGDDRALSKLIERGYYVSVGPEVLCNKAYDDFVDKVPLENMVFESDGPWEYEGEMGVPAMIQSVARHISKKRGINPICVESLVYENACRLFRRFF